MSRPTTHWLLLGAVRDRRCCKYSRFLSLVSIYRSRGLTPVCSYLADAMVSTGLCPWVSSSVSSFPFPSGLVRNLTSVPWLDDSAINHCTASFSLEVCTKPSLAAHREVQCYACPQLARLALRWHQFDPAAILLVGICCSMPTTPSPRPLRQVAPYRCRWYRGWRLTHHVHPHLRCRRWQWTSPPF